MVSTSKIQKGEIIMNKFFYYFYYFNKGCPQVEFKI